jgi:class 3 adenylate cyclase
MALVRLNHFAAHALTSAGRPDGVSSPQKLGLQVDHDDAGEREAMEQATPYSTGTVTFLFTDIEGSTALWERDQQAMAAVVDRHITVLHATMYA